MKIESVKPTNQIKKWFRVASAVKEVENPCHSRKIGVVIIDLKTDSLVSSGHNGPPLGCPKNDDHDYLKNVVWPQLTMDDKFTAKKLMSGLEVWSVKDDKEVCEVYCNQYANSKTCPRKTINAPSGQRLELCTCIHGEVDAITKANRSVAGLTMVCACGVPCIECTKVIINSGLAEVYVIDHGKGDYNPYSSRWLFEKSHVELKLVKDEEIWVGEL